MGSVAISAMQLGKEEMNTKGEDFYRKNVK